MKILLVSSSFGGGGITSYAHELVNAYSQIYEISVVLENDDYCPLDRNKATVFKCSTNVSLENALDLIELINHKICPDIIINSNCLLMSLISRYINNSIRIVSVSHSLRYKEADIAGFASKYVDSIIALSNYNKEYLKKKFRIRGSEKISVVYNFVKDLGNAPFLIEKKKNCRPLKIVYAGGTSAAKSPEIVCKILKQLLSTDLDFIFYFMGASAPTLKRIQFFKNIKELFPLDSRIKFTGRVSRVEAEEIISSANIFLVPSRREGCPMAMLEAMRSGTIILTSDFKNACQEMIEDEKNGFIVSHNQIAQFTNRIIDIINHHESYYKTYQNCYENYVKKFSFKIWKSKMDLIFNQKESRHIERDQVFSKFRFTQDLYRMRINSIYNSIHCFLFETMKSATYFFVENLKK